MVRYGGPTHREFSAFAATKAAASSDWRDASFSNERCYDSYAVVFLSVAVVGVGDASFQLTRRRQTAGVGIKRYAEL